MILLSALIGTIAGALTLTLVITLIHGLIIPEALADGQYFFVWVVTLPIGAILGALSGAALCALRQQRLSTGAKIRLYGSGVTATLMGLMTILTFLGWLGGGSIAEKWWDFRLSLPLYGLPLLWSLYLLQKGPHLVK